MRLANQNNNHTRTCQPTVRAQPLIRIIESSESEQVSQQSSSRSSQSYRLQPAQFFQANRKKTSSINYTEHTQSDSSDSSQIESIIIEAHINQRPQSSKIYDHRNVVQTLKEGPALQLVNEIQLPISPLNDQSHRKNKQAYKLVKAEKCSPIYEPSNSHLKIPQQKKAKINPENKNISHPYQNSNMNDRQERITKNYRQEDRPYEQERLGNILNKPILMQQSRIQTAKSPFYDSKVQFVLKNYPLVVKRLEKNEQNIAFLQKQLDTKIQEDMERERMRMIQLNKERDNHAHINYRIQHNTRQDLYRKELLRLKERHKMEQQMENVRRIELLNPQNRYFNSKAMQQRHRNNNVQKIDQYAIFEPKLHENRSLGTLHSYPESKSFKISNPKADTLSDLDISIIQPKLPSPDYNRRTVRTSPTRVVRSPPPSSQMHHYNPQIMNSSIQTGRRQYGYEAYINKF